MEPGYNTTMENTITNDQVKAALEIVKAVAEAIRELGSVPSGHLYAQLMGHMSLERYNKVIDTLVRTGLVRKEPSHLLVWVG